MTEPLTVLTEAELMEAQKAIQVAICRSIRGRHPDDTSALELNAGAWLGRLIAQARASSALLAERDRLREEVEPFKEVVRDGIELLADASSGFIPWSAEDVAWQTNRDTWCKFARAALSPTPTDEPGITTSPSSPTVEGKG